MDYDRDSRFPFWRKFGTTFGQNKRQSSSTDSSSASSKSSSSRSSTDPAPKSERKILSYTRSASDSYNPDRDYPHSSAYQIKPSSRTTEDISASSRRRYTYRRPGLDTDTASGRHIPSRIPEEDKTSEDSPSNSSRRYLSSSRYSSSSSDVARDKNVTRSVDQDVGSSRTSANRDITDKPSSTTSTASGGEKSSSSSSPQVVRRRKDITSWSGDTVPTTTTESQVGSSRAQKRSSLQLYDDIDSKTKFCGAELPTSNKDLTGVRSIYTEKVLEKAGQFTSSGGRVGAAPGSSSAYRPLVYTPGSPSPLRKSFSGVEGVSELHQEKMASFMAIGRNSVFPDFLSSRGGSQHGQATPAYQDTSSSDSSINSIKQRTLRLFGNGKDNNKTNGSPVGSTKTIKTTTNGNKNASGNGNTVSRNIYRQPASVTANRSRQQGGGADMRRKYYSQRLMWYSEADEAYLDREQFDRPVDKRHHSDLGIASETEPKADSNKNSTQDFIDKVLRGSSSSRGSSSGRGGSILKSASFDYYDKLDYKDLRLDDSSRSGSRRSSVNSETRSALRGGGSPRKRPKMKTRFRDDVAIVYYDQEEKCTAVNSADTVREQEKLKDDKTASSTVTEGSVRFSCNLHPGQPCGYNSTARAILASTSTSKPETDNSTSTNTTSSTTDNDNADNADKLSTLSLTDTNLDVEGNVRKNIFANKKFEIVANSDGSHDLKLIVPIGSQYIRNRTSVKATSGGKRLIVIGYKLEGDGDLAHVHQYIEKMVLPHPIDAYSVKATMDREGNLKISAPVAVIGVNTEQNNAMSRLANER